jgi:hypothetical protein
MVQILSSKAPKTMRVRILREVSLGMGIMTIEGDVWEVSRAIACDLISANSAERVFAEGEIIIRPTEREIISEGPDDPEPKLISRIPERERKPRQRAEFPPNLLAHHVLTENMLRRLR